MIVPTIGRKVWYFSEQGAPEQDATIVDVHDERRVGLFVINRKGTTWAPRSVTLVQEGDPIPAKGGYATWMPYQIGQAHVHPHKTPPPTPTPTPTPAPVSATAKGS